MAILRAFGVVLLIVTPAIVLGSTSAETTQIVALVALIAAIFTFVEYNSASPSLVEFRDAPPFNRIRFVALLTTVFALSIVSHISASSSTLVQLIDAIGRQLAEVIDFPYSPVRLMVLMLPDNAPADLVDRVRTSAGIAYLVSILSLSFFVLMLRLERWPRKSTGFNVWTNLPTFDPTAGADVVARLTRDSSVNLILGFLLPFIIPAVVKLTSDIFNPISLIDAPTRIWTITAWAFLPSSLLMRGIALARIAALISDKRRLANAKDSSELQLA